MGQSILNQTCQKLDISALQKSLFCPQALKKELNLQARLRKIGLYLGINSGAFFRGESVTVYRIKKVTDK
jgi:hypothetical protein